MIWNHDGSLYSFLTTVFRVFEARDMEAEIFGPVSRDSSLFSGKEDQAVAPDEVLAFRVLDGVKKHAGVEARSRIGEAFFSENPNRESVILDYIRKCIHWGHTTLDRKLDPTIIALEKMAQRTRREAHLFQGLLRFQELEDLGLYAPFSPETNVLPLLVPHFSDRLGILTWMIHDISRGVAAISKSNVVEFFHEVRLDQAPNLSSQELEFQELWKGFFKAVAIPGKTNPGLQMQKMPQKYWALLTEMK